MTNKLNIFFLFLSFLIIFTGCKHTSDASIYDIQKSAVSQHGMVVSAHPLASEVGWEILKQGGNAADAAIAVQFALAVVHPRAGNIGGGGFLMYRDSTGTFSSLDYRERSPISSYRDMFLDSNGHVIEGLSKTGILAAGIPGTVAGLVETHKKLGKLRDWSKLVQPAIELADKGFRITLAEAGRLNQFRDVFALHNPEDMPFLAKHLWEEGDVIVQKELASTLREIAQRGHDGFYSGPNAERLVALSDSKKGLFTHNDLTAYQAIWRTPFSFTWEEYNIHTMPLPSSGGIVMNQILKMIEDSLHLVNGNRDPAYIHMLVEAERRAFIERALRLGDKDYYAVPVDSILQPEYIADLFSDFNPDSATVSHYPDSSFLLKREVFETSHLSIVDGHGNAASVTTTLNENYGSKVWVPGGGYFLNNEMDDFSTKPGSPNAFGMIGAEANAIVPGKRMLSSMTPTIIEKNNELWMVIGSTGGPVIITAVLQVFLNVAFFEMDINSAVQESRFHHQWLPDVIMHEKNTFSNEVSDTLALMGHDFREIEGLGLVDAILISNDRFHGAADRRGDDHASGR